MVNRISKYPSTLFLLMLLATLLFSGCASQKKIAKIPRPSATTPVITTHAPPSAQHSDTATPPQKQPDDPIEEAGSALIEEGTTPTKSWALLSRTTTLPIIDRPRHFLKISQHLFNKGQYEQALALLTQPGIFTNKSIEHSQRLLLLGQIYLKTENPKRALKVLGQIKADWREVYHQGQLLKAEAQLLTHQPISAALTLLRTANLDLTTHRQETIRAGWDLLTATHPEKLHKVRLNTSQDELAGWLELAVIATTSRESPAYLKADLEIWQLNYPQHPANNAIVPLYIQQKARPDTIALLLPMSSKYSEVANAIHDGFMTAHKISQSTGKVVVYDFGDEPQLASAYYKMAVEEGADFIVGPLGREAVNAMANNPDTSVPTLILGSNPTGTKEANIWHYGLPPEDEALFAAQISFQAGHRNALALYPDNRWGERIFNTFERHFTTLGGTLVESARYPTDKKDDGALIRRLLGISKGESRKQRVQSAIGPLKYVPKRRADADMLFLVATPSDGRLLKPLINYHQGHDLPVYSTSHIYSGTPDTKKDQDLDGIIFGDLPWTAPSLAWIHSSWKQLADEKPITKGPLSRFYALGLDSYRLMAQLFQPESKSGFKWPGYTGLLTITPQGSISRKPIPMKISQGISTPISTLSSTGPQ